MTPFTKKATDILQKIPHGKVTTYGQIAYLAGNKRAARQIARILYSMSDKHQLPWHRVVNAKGDIVSPNKEKQRDKLISEGVTVNHNDRVNLSIYQWQYDGHEADWMEG